MRAMRVLQGLLRFNGFRALKFGVSGSFSHLRIYSKGNPEEIPEPLVPHCLNLQMEFLPVTDQLHDFLPYRSMYPYSIYPGNPKPKTSNLEPCTLKEPNPNIGALRIIIEFWGRLYYSYTNEEPPK